MLLRKFPYLLNNAVYFEWAGLQQQLNFVDCLKQTENQQVLGVLNFHFGMSVRPEGPKIGA